MFKRTHFSDVYRIIYFRGIESLKDYYKVLHDKGFFDAPASTKYHGNYKGGLFDHSANVAIALKTMTDKLNLKWEREESPLIVGMLHDLCKIDQYKYEDDTYKWDDSPVIKGHGLKSVIYAQKLGIQLTDEEIACIVYHMGAFCPKEEWNDYGEAISKYPNVLWTHTADMVASRVFEI